VWKYYPFYNMSIYALPKDCVCLWIFHVSSPVELFLYALPKDCVCLWIFHVSSPVELFLYALPKDCVCLWIFRWSYFFMHCLRTAVPKDCVCLWIFHVSNPVELFFEVNHIKKIQLGKNVSFIFIYIVHCINIITILLLNRKNLTLPMKDITIFS
jgi:hypothetical protein